MMSSSGVLELRPLAVLAVLCILSGTSIGCGGESESAAELAKSADPNGNPDHSTHESREGIVRLPRATLEEFGIEVTNATAGVLVRSVSLPAEVRPNRDRLAHIAPRFSGIAVEVLAEIGDRVKAGETLAVIEASQSLAPYRLKTLIDGVVIEKHVTRGEPVSQERGALFTVADLSEVWIDLSVYQKYLPDLAIGQHVVVSAGHGLDEAQGTLAYLAPIVDEQTRTATARVVLPNPSGVWRPGMFVTARVEMEREEVPVAVLRSAIEQVEGHSAIFVQEGDGFVSRRVRIGREGETKAEILEGLAPGEPYVMRGGFTLRSELAREELSGGHSH